VPPSRRRTAEFLSRHLANTRPNKILVKFKNGRVRTYEPVFEARKIMVADRQMQRRRAYASAAVARIFGLEPELITAAMSDICHRAMHCGGVAVAPAAALSALPVRLQTQFMIDNNISGALFQRVRLLLGPTAGLAIRERLRADRTLAAAEPQNAAGVNGGGAHLLSPRAALQAMLDHAEATGQFLERLLRGADGRQIEANETFDGQDSAAALPLPGVRDVQICFGLDKGGLHSTCKAVLSNCNQAHPSSRGNTILYGVFPTSKDDYEALTAMAAVYTPDLDGLRQGGLLVGGLPRAVRLILTGDLRFISTWLGHAGHSSTHPCVWCTVVLRRTRTNGSRVDQWGDMQAGSQARGTLRTLSDYEEAAVRYADDGNATLDTPLSVDAHLCIVKRPLLLVDPTHIAPAPLHLTLGITLYLLRLGIEAVYFYGGLPLADVYSQNLARTLRYGVGVDAAPYWGGSFEGRACHKIGERLGMVCNLLSRYVPVAAAEAYSAACEAWQAVLPVLNRTRPASADETEAFRRDSARFVDGMTAFFPWSTVTPKLHVLCCHAPAFLELFGSIGRYSEQGLESWHAHFNQNSRLYTEDTFLASCLTYVRRSAVGRAPGDDGQNRGKRRQPARAGPGARDAKRPDDKRTVAGRALAGCPRRESEACALKHAENCEKWALDNLGEAVRRIDAYRRRIGWTSTEAPAPGGDASLEEGDWHEACLAAEAAEAACWMMLGGSPAAQ